MLAQPAASRRALLAGSMLIAGSALLPARANAGGPLVARDSYRAYVNAFNARDLEGFTRFYAPDVVFDLGGRMTFVGRNAIVDWYEFAWARLREHCTVRRLIMDQTGMAVELETEFVATADWPDFSAGPLKAGDRLLRIGFAHYDVVDGYVTRVATALHKVLERPAHWGRQP